MKPFQISSAAPDIVVTSEGGLETLLIAEVKTDATRVTTRTEESLATAMMRRGSPVGLLFAGGELSIYRHRFTGSESSTIACVGRFPLAGILRLPSTYEAHRNEALAQSWLENLGKPEVSSQLRGGLLAALEEHVLPALAEGQIWAGHPRRFLEAS